MKPKYQIALLVMLSGIGLAAYQLYKFRTEEMVEMRTAERKIEGKISQQKQELKRLQDFAENIERIKEELAQLSLQLDSALEYMPPRFELAGVLRKLTMLAQNTGVKVQRFKPGKEAGGGGAGNFYRTLDISCEIVGTFTQTLSFLDQVARMRRIINVEGLEMKTSRNEAKAGNVIAQTSATLRTYRFVLQ